MDVKLGIHLTLFEFLSTGAGCQTLSNYSNYVSRLSAYSDVSCQNVMYEFLIVYLTSPSCW
jgi:hypothetical protein